MKTKLIPFLIWFMLLLCMSCSSENDTYETVIEPEPQGENPPGENPVAVPAPPQGGENPPVNNPPADNPPITHSPPEGAVEIPGFPKSIDKYNDGSHEFSTQYYYRSDGKLIQISHRYPHYSSGIYTNTFSYDSVGKLIKIEGIDVYDFLWEGERIVRADKNNLAWFGRSEIFYEYNASGQIIQTTENFLETTPPSTAKNLYHYYEDGNPRSVESYFRENVEGKDFELYYTTTFESELIN